MRSVRRTTWWVALLLVSALVGAVVATTTAGAAPAGVPRAVNLSGVTLHVGDQADNHLHSILEGSGELNKLPYQIEWSTFQNGPLLIAAETGGSVDVGKLSETPLVFAQAAGSPVKVVYAGHPINPATASLALVVSKDSKIKRIADLKGKKVGYAPGTVLQYLLANALDSVGLKLSDVTLVNIPPGVDLLASGDADALATGDPTMSTGLVTGKTRILASGAHFTPGFYYLAARNGALSDRKLSAAIGDFTERITTAEQWYNSHPKKAAQLVVAQSKVTTPVANAIVSRAPIAYGPITPAIIAAQQKEADFFFKLGTIKTKIDAKALFDTRYRGKP